MNILWQSEPLQVDGMTITTLATDEGVMVGKTVDGHYASDQLLTADDAVTHAASLLHAANVVRSAK